VIRLLSIDGSFLAYSRFKAGGLIRYFLDRLLDLRAIHRPLVTAVAWDHPGGSGWRKTIHAEYKGDRPPKDPRYFKELAELKEGLPSFGVVQFESEAGEADDILATLVRTRPGPHLIYTADKDMLQLIRPGVMMLKAGAGRAPDMELHAGNLADIPIKMGSTEVRLDARGWRDLLTLAGDPVDKIPGIPKIGPGRALSLLQACPDLVDLVLSGRESLAWERVSAISAGLGKHLERVARARTLLDTTRQLIELRTLNLGDDETIPGQPDKRAAILWLERRGLGAMAERL